TAQAIASLPTTSGTVVGIGQAQPRASPAQFTDLVLVDAGSDAQPWTVLLPKGGGDPVLMDRTGSGADVGGTVYRVAAQPVISGPRVGPSQFLDPLTPAESTGTADASQGPAQIARWQEDERYAAVTRAIAGQPTVLDAAYNAAAAASAGGTHT